MAKKSNAFQAFCKDAFGEDFSQDGFSNIEQIDMILQYIPQKDDVHILDIGCGNGKMLGYLQEKTEAYIHGFDYSEEAIKTAKLLFPKNSEFREGIIGEIDYPEENLEHMWKGILREENEQPLLPNSKNGIPDAKNTWNIMMQAPILIVILNTNGKSPIDEIDTDNRVTASPIHFGYAYEDEK